MWWEYNREAKDTDGHYSQNKDEFGNPKSYPNQLLKFDYFFKILQLILFLFQSTR